MTDYNAKITELEAKIASISRLPTASALTAVEKNPNIQLKKQIMAQKLLKWKRNLLIMIMINRLLLLSLIIQQQGFFDAKL